MRVLICGGRDFTDKNYFWKKMDEISESFDFDNKQPIIIISGKARGADTLAEEYANECGWEFRGYPAKWKLFGKAAGVFRNQEMLDNEEPDLVIVFPGGTGTSDMKTRALRDDYKVIDVPKNEPQTT